MGHTLAKERNSARFRAQFYQFHLRESGYMCDVYLIFDRYHEFSIKSATRLGRSGQLPVAHALIGCDTVAQLWGRGKGTCRKIIEMGKPLNKLGDVNADITEVTEEPKTFVAACCGSRAR